MSRRSSVLCGPSLRLPFPRVSLWGRLGCVTGEEFERLVRDAVDRLPEPIRSRLENTVFLIEERERGREGKILLGLYEGVPYPERGGGEPLVPDRITLFRGPIEREGRTPEGIRRVIHETVLHEVGHFLGLTDEELDRMGLG